MPGLVELVAGLIQLMAGLTELVAGLIQLYAEAVCFIFEISEFCLQSPGGSLGIIEVVDWDWLREWMCSMRVFRWFSSSC